VRWDVGRHEPPGRSGGHHRAHSRRPPPLREQLLLAGALVLVLVLLVGQQLPPGSVAAEPAAQGERVEKASVDAVGGQIDRAAARLAAWMRPLAPGERPPQFVLFSFDGAGSHRHWQRVLMVAGESEARITGFLSGVYLLPDEERKRYRPPGHVAGRSAIGFGGSQEEVDVLIADIEEARRRGHEIGTHYNGHFCDGDDPGVGSWSEAMWDSEVHGIRVFWMPSVRVPALRQQVLLMDYNLWLALNGGRDEPERAAEFSDVVLGAYRAAYTAALNGNRAPLVLGNHFNRWSGGGFSDAVERFVAEVCVLPETVCATHSDVSAWLDMQDPAVLGHWRSMPAAQVPAD
jgi:hypothetical protein